MQSLPTDAVEAARNSSRRTFLKGAAVAPAAFALPASCGAAKQERADGPKVTDFARSFLRWTLDTKVKPPKTVSKPLPMTLNRVRMPIEATATLTRIADGHTIRYALGAECFAEQVWVKRDVWHEPSASMWMIGGEKHCLVEKQWSRANYHATLHPPTLGAQPERQLVDPAEAFAGFAVDLAEVDAVEMKTTDAVIKALNGSATVVSRTEYEAAAHRITLEYPVKTVNFSERERYYQVDTGPVLFPGAITLESDDAPLITACRSAFVAHNAADWAEFLVCVPTRLAGDLSVHHYSKSVRIEGCRNRLFRVS